MQTADIEAVPFDFTSEVRGCSPSPLYASLRCHKMSYNSISYLMTYLLCFSKGGFVQSNGVLAKNFKRLHLLPLLPFAMEGCRTSHYP